MSLFSQIVILLIVLACMVMVLIGIRQLTHFEGFENTDETNHLKDEVEEEGEILSNNNIFHNLVNTEKVDTEKDYKENSKDPFSRKE